MHDLYAAAPVTDVVCPMYSVDRRHRRVGPVRDATPAGR